MFKEIRDLFPEDGSQLSLHPHISWHKIVLDAEAYGRGEHKVLEESDGDNLITNTGRVLILNNILGLGSSGIIISAGAGASSTAATVNDTHLTYEHILNGTRKTLTNTSSVLLTSADVVTELTTISGVDYYRKIVIQATWDSSDANNGHQFAEYGLFTSTAVPGTPSGTSGTMLNHYIDPTPTVKGAGNVIIIQITVRI